MRPILPLPLVVALVSAPAGAQSMIQLDGLGLRDGPNARAAQRPLGPNAQAAQRAVGPNAAIARARKLAGQEMHYPSCAAVRAVRATPLRRGEPGYGRHLDRNGNGLACE